MCFDWLYSVPSTYLSSHPKSGLAKPGPPRLYYPRRSRCRLPEKRHLKTGLGHGISPLIFGRLGASEKARADWLVSANQCAGHESRAA